MASGYSDLSEIQKSGQFYGLNQKPPKINLLDERPRRESLIENQLAGKIERSTLEDQQLQGPAKRRADDTNYRVQESQPSHSMYNVTNFRRDFTSDAPTNMSSQKTSENVSRQPLIAYSELVNDLVQKEVKLRKELAYMNQHLANPWARPPQVREPRREPESRNSTSQQRWVKELPRASASSRPTSRASSTRSTTEADLIEKTEKLLKDVEELEKKPLKTQQVLIERGAERKPNDATSKSSNGSIQTAIIMVPQTEPDNKSPLPFAFDNFSTLGVRGNIASVGAAEPDTPYPPIFPVVKRSPSPRH